MKRLILSLFAFSSVHALMLPSEVKADWYPGLENDFYIQTVSKPLDESRELDCRARIADIMCLVDPLPEGESIPETLNRPCLEGAAAYAGHFEALYDQYPPALQKVFCSLRRINIEKQFVGTAYAGLLYDEEGRMAGAQLGIRQSVLDDNLTLTDWASWKEQLSFGGPKDVYEPVDYLPLVDTATKAGVDDFLYFVITHEFGHMLDFANGLNLTDGCNEKQDEGQECAMVEGTWGAIGWLAPEVPKAKNDFANRARLCFYWCDKNAMSEANVAQVYHDLYWHTDFISTYATRQPWDDFADSLAYYVMDDLLGTHYSIDTRQKKSYDIMAKLHSKRFAAKYEFLRRFLADDIVYP